MDIPVTIVILAAGLGTRMKSRRAKVLHQAGGRTLVEHVVRTAAEITPPERIYVVVGHQADEVRSTLAPYGVGFVHQAEQKGTGHALMAGREALAGLDGLLVILYGDGPLLTTATLRRLVETEKNSDAAGTILTAIMEDPTGYGRVIRDAEGQVTARGRTEGRDARGTGRSARPTWGSTAIARAISGRTSTRSSPTIPRANTTSPIWSRS